LGRVVLIDICSVPGRCRAGIEEESDTDDPGRPIIVTVAVSDRKVPITAPCAVTRSPEAANPFATSSLTRGTPAGDGVSAEAIPMVVAASMMAHPALTGRRERCI
jgi:hypothetical protein